MNREELILAHMDMAEKYAWQSLKRKPPGVLFDDLRSAAWEGLVDAANRHVPERGEFKKYASMRIRGSILDYMRSFDWVSKARRGRVIEETVLYDDEDGTLMKAIRDPLADLLISDRANTAMVRRIIATVAAKILDDRTFEMLVVHWWFDETMKDIADEHGITESRVSQILKAALAALAESPEIAIAAKGV